MIYIAVTFLVCVSVIFAGVHANAINEGRGRKLKKWAWAALYFGFAAILSWASVMGTEKDFNWLLMADSFFIRVVFFNIPLNRMRKPPVAWFYTTPELKTVTGWWDAIRKQRFFDYLVLRVFKKNQWILYVGCFAASIFITIKL